MPVQAVCQAAEGIRQHVLTVVPGWAITKVMLEYRKEVKNDSGGPPVPVLHKYAYLPGIVESVREIIGNLQKGVFRLPENEPSKVLSSRIFSNIPVSTHYKVQVLADFLEDEDEASMLINPDQKVLTFQDTGFFLDFEFTIEKGVGYRKAQEIKRSEEARPDGESVLRLYLDANFNPVKRVGYKIEENNLLFNIETNGAVTPAEAYTFGFRAFQHEIQRIREDE